MTAEQVERSLKTLKVAYDLGVEDTYKALVEALEAEEKSLKRYGRTELYGVHKAIQLVKEMSR